MKILHVFKRTFCFFTLLIFAGMLFAESRSASEKRNDFINAAKALLGTPYVSGGSSYRGVDCSGLTYRAALDAGLGEIPRAVNSLYKYCTPIADSKLEAGDLIFFYEGGNPTHVGIYLGNNRIIHAASQGTKTGVIESSLTSNWYVQHYYGGGRFIESNGKASPLTAAKSKAPSSIAQADETEKKGTPKTGNESSSGSKGSSSSSGSKAKSSSSKKSSNRTIISGVDLCVTPYFGWSLIDANELNFYSKSMSLEFEIHSSSMNLKPGILVRFTENFSPISGEKNDLLIPVCITLNPNKYVRGYFGVIIPTTSDYHFKFSDSIDIWSNEPMYIKGISKPVVVPLFPGIVGVTFATPTFNFDGLKIALVQDISYTSCFAVDSKNLFTFQEKIAAGLDFSTGIKISF